MANSNLELPNRSLMKTDYKMSRLNPLFVASVLHSIWVHSAHACAEIISPAQFVERAITSSENALAIQAVILMATTLLAQRIGKPRAFIPLLGTLTQGRSSMFLAATYLVILLGFSFLLRLFIAPN